MWLLYYIVSDGHSAVGICVSVCVCELGVRIAFKVEGENPILIKFTSPATRPAVGVHTYNTVNNTPYIRVYSH